MAAPTIARTSSRQWAIEVAMRLDTACFPMDREGAEKTLKGIRIDHTPVEKLLEDMHFPITGSTELLSEITSRTCMTACPPEDDWLPRVTFAMKDMTFPLSQEEAHAKLDGIRVSGKDMSELLDTMDFPVSSPAVLLHELSDRAGDLPSRL